MEEYFVEPIIVDTDDLTAPKPGSTLFESRENYLNSFIYKEGEPLVTITIQAYNRLEKTKRCIEYVLKYTTDVDYELILVDNGSSDGTYEYFQSVPFAKKHIIRVTKNVGGAAASEVIRRTRKGKFYVSLGNDVCVTKNWLSNLLKCIQSDDKIAYVVPMMSNCSNLQDPGLKFNNYEEMQIAAEKFNISDSSKWQERMRLVTPMALSRVEVGRIIGIGDPGFYHDFAEDDFSLRMRRLGYKLIVAGDTFVHHDHDVFNLEDKNPEEFSKSLNIGRANFKEKYHGLDAWDDINNFERKLINLLSNVKIENSKPQILGVDVKCGTPILEVKNKLREHFKINDAITSAFTTNAKYYEDLLSICTDVFCNDISNIQDYYKPDSVDILVLGEAINLYEKPIRVLEKLIEIVKKNGVLLFKLKNTVDVKTLLISLGNSYNTDGAMPIHMTIDDLITCVKLMKVSNLQISNSIHSADDGFKNKIKEIINVSGIAKDKEDAFYRVMTDEYLFCITK